MLPLLCCCAATHRDPAKRNSPSPAHAFLASTLPLRRGLIFTQGSGATPVAAAAASALSVSTALPVAAGSGSKAVVTASPQAGDSPKRALAVAEADLVRQSVLRALGREDEAEGCC